MATTYITHRRAKVEHRCAFDSSHNILPGETYVEETVPPWTLILDDIDEDGRPVGSESGEWTHIRYHGRCRDAAEGWLM